MQHGVTTGARFDLQCARGASRDSRCIAHNTSGGALMIKYFLGGMLVLGAGCAGPDGMGAPTPAPTPGGIMTGGGDPGGDVTPSPDDTVTANAATGGTWTRLASVPVPAAGFPMLLTDGPGIISEVSPNRWWRLTPSNLGSYVNGTWSQIAAMPSGYAPLYFGSGVLPDGRVMIEGGEYISNKAVWTTQGAVYNPATNTWASVAPPAGWS